MNKFEIGFVSLWPVLLFVGGAFLTVFAFLKKKHLLEKNLKCVVDEKIYLILEREIKGSENL